MRLPALKIHHKIAIPFTLLFVAAILLVALVSVSLIASALDARVRRQLEHVSETISRADFALNPAILEKVKGIVGAEIVTFDREGKVLVSTLDPETQGGLLGQVRSREVTDRVFEQGQDALIVRDIRNQERPYRVAYRSLRTPPDRVVALVFPTSDIARTRRAISRSIGIIAVAVVVLMALLGPLVARSITSPVHQLVEFTRKLAAGDLGARARVESRDEIGSLAEAFNDMVARLETSEAERLHSEKLAVTGQLAARVAHDVRNPLSSIRMQAQLLRSRVGDDPGGRESLEAILREIERVERVVQGLLDLARPGELHLEEADPNRVLEEALRSAEPGLAHRKIAVQRDLDGAIPRLRLDVDRLGSAFLNLVSNAADAMPEGGRLEVATRLADQGSEVRIEIRDHGSGIDPGLDDRIFDPFFTTRREGVGLGLVNTRSVVERHGGRLELEPAEGGGTRARITLPLAAAPSGNPLPGGPEVGGGGSDGPWRRS